MKKAGSPVFDHKLQLYMPESLSDAIAMAASRRLQSMNEFVRAAVLEKLKKDND